MKHLTGRAVVADTGNVIVSGVRVGQVVQLKNRRWIYTDAEGSQYTDRSWHSRIELLDEIFGAGGWES